MINREKERERAIQSTTLSVTQLFPRYSHNQVNDQAFSRLRERVGETINYERLVNRRRVGRLSAVVLRSQAPEAQLNENEREKGAQRERERQIERQGKDTAIGMTSAVVTLPYGFTKDILKERKEKKKQILYSHRPALCVSTNRPVIMKIVSSDQND